MSRTTNVREFAVVFKFSSGGSHQKPTSVKGAANRTSTTAAVGKLRDGNVLTNTHWGVTRVLVDRRTLRSPVLFTVSSTNRHEKQTPNLGTIFVWRFSTEKKRTTRNVILYWALGTNKENYNEGVFSFANARILSKKKKRKKYENRPRREFRKIARKR